MPSLYDLAVQLQAFVDGELTRDALDAWAAPVLSAARQVIVLVSGAGKQEALRRLLDPAEDSQRTPAKLVQPTAEVVILADAAAAADLQPGLQSPA